MCRSCVLPGLSCVQVRFVDMSTDVQQLSHLGKMVYCALVQAALLHIGGDRCDMLNTGEVMVSKT